MSDFSLPQVEDAFRRFFPDDWPDRVRRWTETAARSNPSPGAFPPHDGEPPLARTGP